MTSTQGEFLSRLAVISLGLALVAGCASSPPRPQPTTPATQQPTEAIAPWAVPAGYKAESFPFPLDFAPTIAHRGVEELRFAPGFFAPGTPGYWAYAFVWRTDDPAQLDAPALAAELSAYFRGLIAAVDETNRISLPDRATIAVTVAPDFTVSAHVFDAFKSALPIDLVGTAERRTCGNGALWVLVMAPATSPRRAELSALAATAACGQPLPPKKPS